MVKEEERPVYLRRPGISVLVQIFEGNGVESNVVSYRFYHVEFVRIIYGTVADVARDTCLFSYVELETIVENGG